MCLRHASGLTDVALASRERLGFKLCAKSDNATIHVHAIATSNAMESDIRHMKASSKVSKIPGSSTASKKHVLAEGFKRCEALTGQTFDFWPETWVLPSEAPLLDAVLSKNKRRQKKKTFIIKPSCGSQGEGISLLQTPSDLRSSPLLSLGRGKSVVQSYLPSPLLLPPPSNQKFDIRVYVLIASVEPLKVYLCKEGLVRFATQAYEKPLRKNLHDASTISLKTASLLKPVLTSATAAMFQGSCSRPPNSTSSSTILAGGGFQILGLDLLIDSTFKVWLLEVNANPSMRLDHEVYGDLGVGVHVKSEVDEFVKTKVWEGAIRIVTDGRNRNGRIRNDGRDGICGDYLNVGEGG
ncbi:hypothetical protein TrRE_jg3181, partial [Triparma retinervis]